MKCKDFHRPTQSVWYNVFTKRLTNFKHRQIQSLASKDLVRRHLCGFDKNIRVKTGSRDIKEHNLPWVANARTEFVGFLLLLLKLWQMQLRMDLSWKEMSLKIIFCNNSVRIRKSFKQQKDNQKYAPYNCRNIRDSYHMIVQRSWNIEICPKSKDSSR